MEEQRLLKLLNVMRTGIMRLNGWTAADHPQHLDGWDDCVECIKMLYAVERNRKEE